MPTYEYKCSACGHKFEKFQSITAAPIKKCAHCGKNKAVRLIGTGAGLIFKGSGFYITDYRSEGYKEKAKADTAPGESKKSDGAAADSKPSEKKESTSTPAAESTPAAKAEFKPESKPQPKPEKKPEAKSSSAKRPG